MHSLAGSTAERWPKPLNRIKRGMQSEAKKDIGRTLYAAGPAAPRREAGTTRPIPVREAS